ncbi:MAG: adenylate kinase [Thermoplasmata archaeon]
MYRVVFLGPPGAGKGTQASTLSRQLGIVHVSTGDLLRSAVAADTPLGREADGHMRAGRLVPDALVLKILHERISLPDARAGFILDGFPRNLPQAEALAAITPLDRVISFEVPSRVLVDRLVDRRVCPRCATVYNVRSHPPRNVGVCDRDGESLVQRPDDRLEAVTTRLKVYAEQTAPLLEHYRSRGLLHPIDATGSAEAVARRLRAALDKPEGSVDPGSRTPASGSAPVR